MRRRAARPAACPLQGSTWAETPPCWSVTCCWPTLENTTVRSRLGESTTGARSTSLCWVSVVRHIALYTNTHSHTHAHTRVACLPSSYEKTQTYLYIRSHTVSHTHRPNHWIISLAHFLRHADWSNDSIWFRQCDLISLMLFGFVRIGFVDEVRPET